MLEAQLLIIEVYKFLQLQATNFMRCVKYTFKTYIEEKNEVLIYRHLINHSESRLAESAQGEKIDLCGNEEDGSDTRLVPVCNIDAQDFQMPTPFTAIGTDAANFIQENIHQGNMLKANKWINDDCINFYVKHVLEPMAAESKENIRILSTLFFQRLYFDNKCLTGAGFFMNFHDALAYWKDDGDIYMIPINIVNEHWVLFTLDFPNRVMMYFDSLGSYKGWDGTVFMEVIFDFLKQFHLKYVEDPFDTTNWKYISSKDFFKWSTKIKRYKDVPQSNGYDCGLFVLKYIELFIKNPDQRELLQDLIKKSLPDRSTYKKHFLGLYVEYQKRNVSDNEGTPQKRKKRQKEESWGTEMSFKRTKSDRDRSELTLRESTERMARVYVTTPTKPEKLIDSDESEAEATFSPIVSNIPKEPNQKVPEMEMLSDSNSKSEVQTSFTQNSIQSNYVNAEVMDETDFKRTPLISKDIECAEDITIMT